jgi:NitT/TauT family transport system substrate-binding protein
MVNRLVPLILVALGVLTPVAAQETKLEKIALAFSAPSPGSDSTFLFAGKQLGFFKEQGVDLEIQTTPGAVAAAGLVASGALDVALGAMEAVPGYVLQGVPMRAIYQFAYRPIFWLGLFKGGKVQAVTDLKGKRVGVISMGSASIPVLQYMLREANLTLSDVTLVPTGFGNAAVTAMKRGEVDAVMYHDTAYPVFAAEGLEFTFVSSPKLQQGYAGPGLYALERTYTARRRAFEGLLRGMTKSLAYATRNPEGATRAFGQLHPEAARNPRLEQALWQERMKILALPPEANGQWGYTATAYWSNVLDVLLLAGTIKERPPVEKLYTTEFLAAANQVDLSRMP